MTSETNSNLAFQIKESVFNSNVNDLNGKTSDSPPDNLVNPFEKSFEGSSDASVVNNRSVSRRRNPLELG